MSSNLAGLTDSNKDAKRQSGGEENVLRLQAPVQQLNDSPVEKKSTRRKSPHKWRRIGT